MLNWFGKQIDVNIIHAIFNETNFEQHRGTYKLKKEINLFEPLYLYYQPLVIVVLHMYP